MTTTTDTGETLALQSVTVEDAGPAVKKITVEIAASVVDERLRGSMDLLVAQSTLPGFRPGKAPRKLLERRFGKGIREETRGKIIQDASSQAIKDKDIRAFSQPYLKDAESITVEEGQGLTFTFEVEVIPDFKMPNLEGIEVSRPQLEVTDETIQEEVASQMERRGRYDPVEGDAKPGDTFLGAATVANEEGEIVAEGREVASRMPEKGGDGQGILAGLQVDGLDKILKGKKAGDDVVVETVGPENYEIEESRGKPIKITFNIVQVVRVIPATIEELVELAGVEDEATYRERVKEAIGFQIQGEQMDVMRRQIVKHLTETIEMELPPRASALQAARTMENFRLRMMNQGIPEHVIEERMAEIRSASSERAQNDLKILFIMERVSDELDINVTDPEVNNRIFQMARRQGERPEKMRDDLIRTGRAAMLVTQIRHEKAADILVEKAKIKDITADEWNAMMEAESEAEGGAAPKKTSKKKTSKKTSTKPASADEGKKKTTKKKTKKKDD